MYTRTQPFLLLTLITALLTKEAHGVLTKIGARDEPFLNEIQIRCTDNGGVLLTTDNLALRRTVLVDGQLNTQPFTDIIISIGVIRFDVDPTIEGNYTCVDQDTDTVASNSVIVVAFPTTDPMFTIPNLNFVPLGSSPVIHCSFLQGPLTEYYEVMWYRGVSLLDTASVESRFKETDNLTLTIQDVNLEDASDSYYCELFVRDPQTDVVRSGLGYDVSLTVYGELDLYPNTLIDTAIETGSPSVQFSCTVESAPVGDIKWLINGTDLPTDNRYTIQSSQVNTTLTYAVVTSNLTITDPVPGDSSLIQCVGFANNGFETMFLVNQASLTIISNDFYPVFEVTSSDDLTLSIAFPGIILEVFTLHIRFVNTMNAFDTFELVPSDPLFYNTSVIDGYIIPNRLHPSFHSFKAAVAIQVLNIIGDYTDLTSDTIVLGTPSGTDAPPSTTDTNPFPSATPTSQGPISTNPSPSSTNNPYCVQCSCNSTTPLLIAIGVLIVLLVIVVLCLIAVCFHIGMVARKARMRGVCLRDQGSGDAELKELELRVTNLSYTKDSSYTTSTSPTHTSSSDDTHTHTHSDTNSYYSSEGHSRSTTHTPSRPSSQETCHYNRSIRTESPFTPSHNHIYENEEILKHKEEEEEGEGEKGNKSHHTMSSIAVGTSPPRDGKEIIIPRFLKGQSESPKRRGEDHRGVLSPARSDPSLESSLKSEAAAAAKKPLSQSIAIPSTGSKAKDQSTITSPTQNSTQFVAKKKEPEKGDEKIDEKIKTEYVVI